MRHVRNVIATLVLTLCAAAYMRAQAGFAANAPDGAGEAAAQVGTAANAPPVANAGPDAALAVGKSFVLNGTGSSDPDGDKLTYLWSMVSAPPASPGIIANPTKSKAKLILDRAGTYVVQLVVKDGVLTSAPDQAVITTTNAAPVASAGPDRVATVGTVVQLDGSASSDLNGDPLTYFWKLKRPKGSTAALSDTTSVRPSFVPDKDGTYSATLTASDGVLTKTDTVVVTTNANIAPIARAGGDHAAMVAGQTVVLDGSTSTDANGDALTYAWAITKQPGASTATLGSPNTVRATFTADVKGKYTFTLTATDPLGGISTDQIVYSAAPPVADAGPDHSVTAGALVALDGSGSSHLNGTLYYGWSLLSVPAGSTAALDDPGDPQPRFVADLPGIYVAQLVAFDGALLSAADTAVVTVNGNMAPRIDLGPDQVVSTGTTVTLDDSAVFDPDPGALTLRWALLARPAASTAALSAATGSVTQLPVDVAGAYVVQLIAQDQDGASSTGTVVITTAQGRPAVDVGPDRGATLGAAVHLAAVAADPDGGAVSYAWRMLSYPDGTSPALAGATTATPSFTPTAAGFYVVQVLVTDSDRIEALDTLVIRAAGSTVVTIEATDSTAAELGPNAGTFTLTRTGDPSLPLNGVSYTRSGTATAGTDYTPALSASGSVNFAAGESTTTITITPVEDSAVEGDETVVLTLVDGPSYDLGGPGTQSATITIKDGGSAGDGTVHTGSILLAGEVDAWTFNAVAGARIDVHIGEITGSPTFLPWIRLISPTSATLGSASGAAAALIDLEAPVSGTYTVLVASADATHVGTGTYRLELTHTPGPVGVSPGDQGGLLVNGLVHTGEIVLGDVDTWTFTATAGDHVDLHLGELTADANFLPWMRVWKSSGGAEVDSAAGSAATLLDFVAPTTGTYFVLVSTADATHIGTGTYRLEYTRTPGPVGLSPGDQGGALSNGLVHTGQIVLGDVDTWTFTATAGDHVDLHLGELTGDPNFLPWMRVWKSSGGAEVGSAAGSAATLLDFVVPETGTYLVLVSTSDATHVGTGTYRLEATRTPGPVGLSAGDQGGALSNGLVHTGEIVLGDVDTWTFTATAGDHVDLHLGELTADANFLPWMRVWKSSGGAEVDSSAGSAATLLDFVAPTTGTYFVLVSTADATHIGTGTYRLEYTRTPGPVGLSPGDQGGALTNGAVHNGEIVLGDVDTWTFTATAGDHVDLHLGELTADANFLPWMRVWKSSGGAEVDSSAGSAATLLDFVAPTTGTYFVLVSTADATHIGTGTYRLEYTRTPGPVGLSSGDQGGALSNGLVHTGEIVLGDVDTWTFTATAGDHVDLHLGELTADANFLPWMRVWKSSGGAEVNSAAGSSATLLDFVAPTTGTYFVLVSTADATHIGTGTYRLEYTRTPGPVGLSPGDQGGALTNGAVHNGEIVLGDADTWTIGAVAGQPMTVTVTELTGNASFVPSIRLWTSTGAVVNSASGASSATINVPAAPASGTYFVLVSTADATHIGTGTYSLQVTVGP